MSLFRRREKTPPGAGGNVAIACAEPPDYIELVLHQVCAEAVAATLVTDGMHQVCRGRFRAVDDGRVVVEVTDPHAPLQSLALCTVIFATGDKTRVFISSVREVEAVDGGLRVALAMPEELAGTEGRTAFRVPVTQQAALRVLLEVEGSAVEVEAEDVSLVGMAIHLPAGFEPQPGATVTAQVGDSEESIVLDAEVRRVDVGLCGLSFRDAVSGGRVEPPPELRRIVQRLEFAWLRSRART